MGSRSTIFKFFVILLLLSVIAVQIMSMIQSDRLYMRLNQVEQSVRNIAASGAGTVVKTIAEREGDGGDWLVWCLGGEPYSLNPVTSSDRSQNYIVSGNISESLLERDLDTMQLKLKLAESYEVSEDGLEISFRINPLARFSDGVPVTADDVIFTYNTIVDPAVDAAPLASYLSNIDKVEKVSDLEVKFYLKQTYFLSLEIVSGIQILPKHIFAYEKAEEFNKRVSNPVGSGPYIFDKWNVGKEIVLKRNENYWAAKPKLEKIVFKFIPNSTAAFQALKSGEVDFLVPSSEQYYEYKDKEDFSQKFYALSYWSPFGGYSWIGWNQNTPFFKDKRVRQAMTYMLDREMMLKYLAKNPEGKIQTGPFYIMGKQADPDVKPLTFDPEKAALLLREAGWQDTDGDGILDKDGVKFSFRYMIVSGSPIFEQLAKFLKDSAAKLGIEVVPDQYEWSVFTQRLEKRDFDAVTLSWGGGGVESDPYQIWHSSQITGGSNYVGFNNPQADELIENARIILDQTKRNELYHQLHRLIQDEQPYTFLFTSPERYFLDRRFENVKIHQLGIDPLEWFVPTEKQRY